jgi:hypothetical protein
MAALARCDNVAVKIFGVERIFGLHWTAPKSVHGYLATMYSDA